MAIRSPEVLEVEIVIHARSEAIIS